jgi:hypothetical protein
LASYALHWPTHICFVDGCLLDPFGVEV